MDENERVATEVLKKYLLDNKKSIQLNDDAKEILEEDINEFTYSEYEAPEIIQKLTEAGVDISKLPRENWNKLFDEKKPANYIKGWKMILIRKAIVTTKFLMCEFIHEFAHYKFHIRAWTKENYKPHKSSIPVEDEEEYTCKILSMEYAQKNDFSKEYRKRIGLG